MAKQPLNIQEFHGGLNSDSDPRDLKPSESPSLQDVAIDSIGRLKVLGSADDGNIYHSGTAQAGASATITLASGASSADDKYNNFTIVLTGGTGSGQTKTITDYTGSTRVANVSSWSTNPDNTTTYEIRGDGNTTSILQNRGLFTMSSDRQLDAGVADETLIFLHDNANHTIDVKDSEGWDTAQINMGGATIPVYYNADGVVRVSDASLTQGSQWFGYIEDQRFASLNAAGATSEWVNASQSLSAPESGKCLTSTPLVGTDSNGVFSDNAEYKGSVIDDGSSSDQVVDHSSVNLRVGIQLNEIVVEPTASGISWTRATEADSTDLYPCIGKTVVKGTGTSSSLRTSLIEISGLEYSISENQVLIVPVFMIQAEYNKLVKFQVRSYTDVATDYTTWEFGVDQLKPDMWNLLVCGADNISSGSELFPREDEDDIMIAAYDNTSDGGGSAHKMDYYISGIAIADAQPASAFTAGVYTFHHTYLYDVENKQESLPFQFSNATSDSAPHNVNSINVVGLPVLFNFDIYICSNVSAGNAYGLNKRISGSRLYWKVEENDNYFLLGELDFIKKGFKWTTEADNNSYDMTNTSDTTAPILSKTAIIKGISPESSNIVDTFKSINGFSSEVKSLDAKYKTAVVQGRRTYIGNIKRPDGKTYPDRIVKSQVNRFDTFPEGMGVVDVAIRDGENIVKLEAFADRILQFKENSLYIINVSENIDFLEDTYRNRGCTFDYHVTKTDIGIAWFNIHGVYLYNGKEVSELLVKEGIRVISESDWEAFITDATDDPDTSSAMIGYIPKKKQILIKNENNDVYIYDFVLRAWTTGSGRITESTAMTNFALDADQNLFYVDNTTTVRKTWQPSPQSTTNFIYKTPDIDFGQPAVRKKVYRVRISYKGDADTLTVGYSVNGDTNTIVDFEGTDSTTGKPSGSTDTTPLHDKTDLTVWHHAELKPDTSSEANNIYSFQLHMSGTVDSDFEINDISIIYRMKSVK